MRRSLRFGAGLLTPPTARPQVSEAPGDLRSRSVARSGDRPQRRPLLATVTSHRFDCMWIKICGIRDVETALMAAAAGADAIGLNFYGKSPRVVAPAVAVNIVDRLRGHSARAVEPVGVFVNHSVAEIREICEE